MSTYTQGHNTSNSKQNAQDNVGTYSGARDATTSTIFPLSTGTLNILHNSLISTTYYVRRGDLQFDTSGIASDATISSVTLRMRASASGGSNADTDTVVALDNTNNANLTSPVVSEDMDDYGSTPIGSEPLASYTNTNTDVDLVITDFDVINKGGTTRIGLRLQGDIDNSTPTGSNVLRIDTSTTCELIVTTSPKYAINDTDILDNCVSWWPLNELSSAAGAVTRYDAHGSNHLTDNNTTASAAGNWNRGADFERSNSEKLTITDASQTGLDITGDMSIAMWFKFETNNAGQQVFASKWLSSGTSRGFLFYKESDNFIRFAVSNDGTFNGAVSVAWTPSNGVWYHMAVVYDSSAGSAAFYIDGTQQGTTQTGLDTSIVNNSTAFDLGASEDGSFVDGVMQDACIFNATLTAAQISRLYNSGDGMTYGIDYDNSAEIANWTTTNPVTGNYTITGENPALFLTIFASNATVITATYGGESMTLVEYQSDFANKNYLFKLNNPPTGTNSFSITHNGGSNITPVAASYIGVNQTEMEDNRTVMETEQFSVTSSTTASVTPTQDNCWIALFMRDTDARVTSITTTDTKRIDGSIIDQEVWDTAGTVAASAQSATLTLSPAGRLQGVNLFVIAPVAAPAAAGNTLTAALGTFTLTGNSTNFTVSRSLTADTGAFTLTGIAASLAVTRKLSASVGSFLTTFLPANFTVRGKSIWVDRTKKSTTFSSRDKKGTTWNNRNKV